MFTDKVAFRYSTQSLIHTTTSCSLHSTVKCQISFVHKKLCMVISRHDCSHFGCSKPSICRASQEIGFRPGKSERNSYLSIYSHIKLHFEEGIRPSKLRGPVNRGFTLYCSGFEITSSLQSQVSSLSRWNLTELYFLCLSGHLSASDGHRGLRRDVGLLEAGLADNEVSN